MPKIETSEKGGEDSAARREPGRAGWPLAFAIGLTLLLWLPRLQGPIDLRWDAAVYYVLGTSLAQGTGYRLLNEPGQVAAVQYPPLLPAYVALHQKVLGTSDPLIVGQALRLSALALSLLYTGAVFALARRFMPPRYALGTALLTALYVQTFFLSDLVFAEVPFALVTVAFLLVRDREAAWAPPLAAVLAAFAFLLRTVGIALLAAWVAESLLGRRFRQATLRGAIALLPVLLWQGYVRSVVSGPEYREPAYAYQRAPYQYYNVTYGENLRLVDSFRPEAGTLSPAALLRRVAGNAGELLMRLGEGVSVTRMFWEAWLGRLDRWLGSLGFPPWLGAVPSALLSALILPGLVLLARRGGQLMAMYVALTLGLICLTPWPGQFPRYLAPVTPLLGMALMLALQFVQARVGANGVAFTRVVLACIFACQLLTVYTSYGFEHQRVTWAGRSVGRFFFYDVPYSSFDTALDWLRSHARPEDVVATSAPQYTYLRTGLRAVMPPMEADPAQAQRLLDAVPIHYLVIDDFPSPDMSRRYAAPLVEAGPELWQEVYSSPRDALRVYRRTASDGSTPRDSP